MNNYPSYIKPSTNTHCQAPGCTMTNNVTTALAESVPRPAAPGTDLCNIHHARFPRVLLDLVSSWTDLEAALYRKPASGPTNDRVQTSTIADLSQSWNPYVTEVMAQIADWTGFLVRTIVRERPRPDDAQAEDPDARRLSIHSRGADASANPRLFLAMIAKHEALWLSSYPNLGSFLLQDAIDFRTEILGALNSSPVRRVGLKNSVCGEVVVDNEYGAFECRAPMVGILRDDGRPSTIVCSVHPRVHARYTREQWMEWSHGS